MSLSLKKRSVLGQEVTSDSHRNHYQTLLGLLVGRPKLTPDPV